MRTSLVVTPTAETLGRLSEMTQSSILQLDLDLTSIEILAVNMPVDWTPEPHTVYDDVKVSNVEIESQGSMTLLVATVSSAKLTQRAQLLGARVTDFRWILKYDVQPGRSTRLAITTLTDVLVYREAPFSFTDEMLLQV